MPRFLQSDLSIYHSVRQLDLRSESQRSARVRGNIVRDRRLAVGRLGGVNPSPLTSNSSAGGFTNSSSAPNSVGSFRGVHSADAQKVAQLEKELKEARAVIEDREKELSYLSDTLAVYVDRFADVLSLIPDNQKSLEYYTVVFGPGPIGLILTVENGNVQVAELRNGPDGKPLLAKASGKIAVGDILLAINDYALFAAGEEPSLEEVAAIFKESTRPMRVLFRRV